MSIAPIEIRMRPDQIEVKKRKQRKVRTMSKRAIIVIDLQNEYWPGGALPLDGIDTAAANAARVIAHGREAGDLIVVVCGTPLSVGGRTDLVKLHRIGQA